jgi:hypothetical protein
MKVLYLLILFQLFFFQGITQNLIPNPSFENFSVCPTTSNQLLNATPWYKPTSASPDYFNQCALSFSGVSVPVNSFGNQNAHTGVAYAGLFAWLMGNGWEYIAVNLISPLIANQCYHFEMYVSVADQSLYTSDNIGVYFSVTPPPFVPNSFPLTLTPQIENVPGNYFSDSTWTLVSGDYVAIGGETNIIIGNFKDFSHTNRLTFPNIFTPRVQCCYVFIDDVSLTQTCSVLPVELLNFSIRKFGHASELFWTTLSETNNDYFIIEKSNNAKNYFELGKIKGAGNTSLKTEYHFMDVYPSKDLAYYRLKQVDIDGKHSYSEVISMEIKNDEAIRFDPNPSKGETTLDFPNTLYGKTIFKVFDSQGKIILDFFEEKEMDSYRLNTESFDPGVYILFVENNQLQLKSKLIVQ